MSAGKRDAGTRTLLLAGDVGGTKTNLGLFRAPARPPGRGSEDPPGDAGHASDAEPRLLRAGHYASADYPDLGALAADFLAGEGSAVGAACFGVAGPVVDNYSRTTNLPWEIDGERLAAELGLPRARLVNDLVATAEGIALLAPDDFALLHAGNPGGDGGPSETRGNRVLLAAGTGLGMCLMPLVGGVHVAVASEGGHMDFAPGDEEEAALLVSLRRRHGGHVSVERVVSGDGLVHVYEHLREHGPAPADTGVEAALRGEGDAARAISEAALAGRSEICQRALALFVSAYGASAGNLALLGTAVGGVYLGGGIAPKILPKLADGTFVRAFLAKGRFRSYLEAIPVRVLLNERTAMFGAARLAARLLAG